MLPKMSVVNKLIKEHKLNKSLPTVDSLQAMTPAGKINEGTKMKISRMMWYQIESLVRL